MLCEGGRRGGEKEGRGNGEEGEKGRSDCWWLVVRQQELG
jgi:hypothetical protein